MLRHLLFLGLTLANWGFAKEPLHTTAKLGASAASSNIVGGGTYETCSRPSEESPKLTCWQNENGPGNQFTCSAFVGLTFTKATVSGTTLLALRNGEKVTLPCMNPTQNTLNFSPFFETSRAKTRFEGGF